MITDRQIEEAVQALTAITWLIMPDRIQKLPPNEQLRWARKTTAEALAAAHGNKGETA